MKNKKTGEIKSRRETFFGALTDCLFFALGSLLFGLGVNMFAVPNNISNGGAVGAATIINRLFPVLPIGSAMLLINIPLFITAFIVYGKKILVKSFAATLIMSVTTDFIKPFVPPAPENRLLASIFYGVCVGAGTSLILIRGATSGGTDITAKLLKRKFPFLSLGRAVFFCDSVIIIASGIVFGSVEDSLYAAVVVFVSGEIIDRVLYGSERAKVFLVFTDEAQAITDKVTLEMGRGITSVSVTGGYTGQERKMLICAVRFSQISRLKKIIRSADPKAFTIIIESGEITGEGFKIPEGEE